MRVKLNITVDVAAHEWARLNGLMDANGRVSFESVERDVQLYYLNIVQTAAMTGEAKAVIEIQG